MSTKNIFNKKIIEVVAISGDNRWLIENITVAEFRKMKRKKGFNYTPFQRGFSAYQNIKRINFKNQ
jgi:uncharacterized protein YjhX (UPF0386 family)